MAPGTENRPHVVIPEEPIGRAAHVQHVLDVRADTAENSIDGLHKEWRLDQSALEEVGERIEVPDVVALELEPRALLGQFEDDLLDIGKRVAKDPAARAFEERSLPVVLELLCTGA